MPAKKTPEKPIDTPLADLVTCLVTAKAVEETARKARIEWEERIAEKVGGPDSGQKTTTLKDGMKVTVTRGFNYKANCEEIRKMFRLEQFDHPAPVSTKSTLKLDERGYRWYEKTLPSVFRRIAEYVTVTPKKIAVELKAPKV